MVRLKGITIGKGCNFNGWTKFVHGSKDSIQIGNDCTFKSKHTSNLIGINRPCIFSSIGESGSKLIIGNGCGFSGTVIGCFDNITLGDNVRCGANTLITDSDWHMDDPRSGKPSPIQIGNNVWLGVNVTVLKGVSIGENTVIGANSLVVRSIPANVIAAGNPCKIMRSL
ncbi:MAG: acyltransferase [Ignavibacteriaceae bacterium]|nr:acyltransferase [Ignavibacteriaceae bacterium]